MKKSLYLINAWICLHQMLFICSAHNFAQIRCFTLYLLDVGQIDSNTSFENEFHKWAEGIARQALLRLYWQGLLVAKQPRPESPRPPHVGSHVGEVPEQKAQGGHSNIRLINLFRACHCSLASYAHATFQHLFLVVANLWEVRYSELLISENWTLTLTLHHFIQYWGTEWTRKIYTKYSCTTCDFHVGTFYFASPCR